MTLKQNSFESIVGKGGNAGNQHLFLFPQCFLLYPKRCFLHYPKQCSTYTFDLEKSKILSSHKGLVLSASTTYTGSQSLSLATNTTIFKIMLAKEKMFVSNNVF